MATATEEKMHHKAFAILSIIITIFAFYLAMTNDSLFSGCVILIFAAAIIIFGVGPLTNTINIFKDSH